MWEPTSPTGAQPSASPFPPTATTHRQKNPGRRFAQIVRLKPDRAAEYAALHRTVWPEVLQQIRECNIEDYSIWWDRGTGLLFASFKYVGYDWAGDCEVMRANEKVREWWALTDGMQESLVEGAGSSEEEGGPGWWKPVEEVFYYNP